MHAVEKAVSRILNSKVRLHERTGVVTELCPALVWRNCNSAHGQPLVFQKRFDGLDNI
jgi:hypothetical protein